MITHALVLAALLLPLQDDPFGIPGEEAEVELTSTSIEPGEAKVGDVVQVKLGVRVKEGWHYYSCTADPKGTIPAYFELDESVPARPGGVIIEPTPKTWNFFGTDYPVHEGEFVLSLPVVITGDAKEGDIVLSGKLCGQVCEEVCLNVELPFRVSLKVLPGGVEAPTLLAPANGITTSDSTAAFDWSDVTGATYDLQMDDSAEFDSPEIDETGLTVSGYTPPTALADGTCFWRVRAKDSSGNVGTWNAAWTFTVNATTGPAVPEEGGKKVQSEEAKELLEKGFLGFLLACVFGGLISLIMPCVYPLIPITLTFFVKQSSGSKARTTGLAFMYGLGIIVTFTGLGFLLSKVIGVVGARVFAADPWVNLVIAAIFLLLGFSLLGMFELKLPGFLTNRVSGGAPKQGGLGAFGLGLIFAIVTFTCTIPVAGGLLSLAASGGNAGWALAGMLVYSITMAFPFLMLGLFPGLLQKIPRSGGWLETVKVGAGFLEIALVFYYLAKADFGFFGLEGYMSREMVLAIWVGLMVATSAWLLGVWRFNNDPESKGIGFGRATWAFLFGVFGIWLATGLVGNHLGAFETVLPISENSGSSRPGGVEKPEEFRDYDEALAAAKKESKPVFVDFTGFT